MVKETVIREAVHGDVRLTALQTEVLDTAEVQRLRGIKQLGAAYLVYPGCTHTRFEHSLGTLATVRQIIDSLRQKGYAVGREDEELIGVAALLHDVAHIPFGHTLEDELHIFPRHDKMERLRPFLEEGEVGALLRREGLTREITALLCGREGWRSEVVAGSIDADLLDYLRRDARCAGITQDYDDRIYSYFCLAEGHLAVDLAKDGTDRPAARSEIIHLLRMRGFLMERVYLHHAKVAAGAMVGKAVELALERGAKAGDICWRCDAGLLAWLADSSPEGAELAGGVLRRRLYKRAYGLSGLYLSSGERQALVEQFVFPPPKRRATESAIARLAGVPPHRVIIGFTGHSPMREVDMPAYTGRGLHPLGHPPVPGREDKVPADIRSIIEQHESMWRLWVFTSPEALPAVGRAAESILGIPGDYRRPL